MKRIPILALAFFVCMPLGYGQTSPLCDAFQSLVKVTYNFKPSKLPPAELNRKAADMDKVWDVVTADTKQMMPCLRQALEDPGADTWFLFDGGMLLVQNDPSREAKKLQVRGLISVDLDDVNLHTWVAAVTGRGIEGFDLSEAGAHWLSYGDAHYSTSEPVVEVDAAMAALFIYGSMDEGFATPALAKIAADMNHPGRKMALDILQKEATTEAMDALRKLDALVKPDLIQPRPQPKATREQFVKAFQSAILEDFSALQELMDQTTDSERDVVAVLKTEDLGLLRRIRRRVISTANPSALDYYTQFTRILLSLTWK